MRAVLFDHIAIAVPRLADADAVLAGQLGGRSTFGATTDEYRFWHWRYDGGGDLEVLEPAGEDGFLHPKQAQGIVVQLAETNVHQPGEPSNDAGSGHQTPNPPAIRVLGLRLSARSRVDANTQWGTVLRGERLDRGVDELVFRWPGSFMRVTVEIDPLRGEGPLGIEYASRRPVTLPDGAHLVLGAVFTRRSID